MIGQFQGGQGSGLIGNYQGEDEFMGNKDPRNFFDKSNVNNQNYDWNGDGYVDKYDTLFLQLLTDIHTQLNGEKIDLLNLKNLFDNMENIRKTSTKNFVHALLRPEKSRGAKIPSSMPIPSSSFQMKSSLSVTTNSTGNAAIAINPFYLTTGQNSSVYVNNDVNLNGSTVVANQFFPRQANQNIPASVYHQYRLVSASVVCKYVGRLDIVQGLVGGSILYEKGITASPLVPAVALPQLDRYCDFNLARDSTYNAEYFAIQGIRLLYFPLDPSFEEYQSVNTAKDGFLFFIYINNGPPLASSFKIDLYFNFECLPDVAFLNYIPTEMSDWSILTKEEAYAAVKNNAIGKESDFSDSTNPKKVDYFTKLMGKWGRYLPKMNDWKSGVIAQNQKLQDQQNQGNKYYYD